MNRYPAWKYLLVVVVVALASVYAVPNYFGEEPALQIKSGKNAKVDLDIQKRLEARFKEAGVSIAGTELDLTNDKLVFKFETGDEQLKARDLALKEVFSRQNEASDFVVALTAVTKTPQVLLDIGADPVSLGLDLRGGVHFLFQVDVDRAIAQKFEGYESVFKQTLREDNIRWRGVDAGKQSINVKFASAEKRDAAIALLSEEYKELTFQVIEGSNDLTAFFNEDNLKQQQKNSVQQNIVTLRNRVNALGVAEPLVQQQGADRIVVQLPGVRDPAQAKRILESTATLEFRLVYLDADPYDVAQSRRVPPGAKLYFDGNNQPVLLKREVIVTGESIVNASSSIDTQNGQSQVNIELDGRGGNRMKNTTKDNLKKPMATVFIETIPAVRDSEGNILKPAKPVQKVINVATIQDVLFTNFRITGLDSPQEAHELAVLLRAGALAAPMEIVEERTVGPSMGAENIRRGFSAVKIGLLAVAIFMLVYYKMFGLFANLALTANLVIMLAALTILPATLTLPGIAGIVLTVGMAVDANVLIFERIREELRNGLSFQQAIDEGYSKAVATIADANITTLIAAMVLMAMGSGPIKGFAVTLGIGILTSMFTAIMGTRALTNLVYGNRKIGKLSI